MSPSMLLALMQLEGHTVDKDHITGASRLYRDGMFPQVLKHTLKPQLLDPALTLPIQWQMQVQDLALGVESEDIFTPSHCDAAGRHHGSQCLFPTLTEQPWVERAWHGTKDILRRIDLPQHLLTPSGTPMILWLLLDYAEEGVERGWTIPAGGPFSMQI